ncbi:MAG: acyltransferase [Acidimicrobiales bacterium]
MSTPGAASSVSPRAYRADIDGLRAVSILAVVLFHAGVTRFAGGYVGVDVFFVISGFLITGLLVKEVESAGRVSMRNFYARRIRRLLPLSVTVTITTLVLGLWLLAPVARDALVGDARAATLYFANWRFAAQTTAYSDVNVTDSLLVHYWSLAIEEQFYVLWPLLIVAGLGIARVLRRPVRSTLGVLLAALVALSFTASVVITADEGVGAYYLTHTRLWEMGVGAGLALVLTSSPRLPSRALDALGMLGLGMIAWAATTFDARTPFPGSAALLPVLGCAAVIVAGSQQDGVVSRALAARPFPFIGRLSYAWYLWHWPAIGIALLLRGRYWPDTNEHVITAAAVVVSFGLAWGSHIAIEDPMRHASLLRRRLRPTSRWGWSAPPSHWSSAPPFWPTSTGATRRCR